MAEFQEVMRQKKRMCNSVLCCKCDIYRLCGEDLSKCAQFINSNPKKAEEVVMSWAADHPEPVYPTWLDWLEMMGIVFYKPISETESRATVFGPEAIKHIPADIAEKLGIDPINK